MDQFYPHKGAIGTQHNVAEGDPNYWLSHSGIPTLPTFSGFMGTHGVYRHFSIMEQTAIIIGEPKHGLWRIHENGFVREYLKANAKNCWPANSTKNPNDDLTPDEFDVLKNSYSHFEPEESWSFYKYPDEMVNDNGCLNFVDLTIYHPKYNDSYENHEPIDLPMYYCTMSQNDYPHVKQAWNYAKIQVNSNQVGPLGRRAGLDVKHNYLHAIRFELLENIFA